MGRIHLPAILGQLKVAITVRDLTSTVIILKRTYLAYLAHSRGFPFFPEFWICLQLMVAALSLAFPLVSAIHDNLAFATIQHFTAIQLFMSN